MHWRIFSVALAVLGLCTTPGRGATIGEVKSGASRFTSMLVTVTGVVTYVDSQECYVEAADRSSGILVQGDTTAVTLGSNIEATGIYSIAGGEPAIIGASFGPQTGSADIKPFCVLNKSVGGAAPQPYPSILDYIKKGDAPGAWVRAVGAGNTGLLVTTWGIVRVCYRDPSSGTRWFYVDDGTQAVSDLGDIGVLVYSSKELTEGDFVTVTGISSVEPSLDDPTRLIRVIRTRSADDVQVRQPSVPGRPISDEFVSPVLSKWWKAAPMSTTPDTGGYSLTNEPGQLMIWTNGNYLSGMQVVQLAGGEWDMETKVRLNRVPGSQVVQIFDLGLAVGLPGTRAMPIGVELAQIMCGSSSSGSYDRIRLAGWTEPVPFTDDICYLRVRRRTAQTYVSYSTDGVAYSAESESESSSQAPALALQVRNSSMEAAFFSVCVDYVRFTMVTP